MNAHQRRVHRRKDTFWDDMRKLVEKAGLYRLPQSWTSVRPSGTPLTTGRAEGIVLFDLEARPYMRVLKARPLCDNSTLVFDPDGVFSDYSELEKKVVASLCAK